MTPDAMLLISEQEPHTLALRNRHQAPTLDPSPYAMRNMPRASPPHAANTNLVVLFGRSFAKRAVPRRWRRPVVRRPHEKKSLALPWVVWEAWGGRSPSAMRRPRTTPLRADGDPLPKEGHTSASNLCKLGHIRSSVCFCENRRRILQLLLRSATAHWLLASK